MATLIRSTRNVTVPQVYANPVQDGLLCNHIFCSLTDGYFARNFAPNQPDGELYGTVATSLGGSAARFTGLANYLQTGIQEPRVGTVMLVASSQATMADSANSPCFYGTFVNTPRDEATVSNTFGISGRVTASGAVRFGAGRGTSVADDVEGDAAVDVNYGSGGNHAKQALFSCTWPEAAATSATNHTDNENTVVDADTGFDSPRFPTDALVRVGSGYSTYEGECDVSIFRMWDRVLTAAEIAKEVTDVRRFMARLGVTV